MVRRGLALVAERRQAPRRRGDGHHHDQSQCGCRHHEASPPLRRDSRRQPGRDQQKQFGQTHRSQGESGPRPKWQRPAVLELALREEEEQGRIENRHQGQGAGDSMPGTPPEHEASCHEHNEEGLGPTKRKQVVQADTSDEVGIRHPRVFRHERDPPHAGQGPSDHHDRRHPHQQGPPLPIQMHDDDEHRGRQHEDPGERVCDSGGGKAECRGGSPAALTHHEREEADGEDGQGQSEGVAELTARGTEDGSATGAGGVEQEHQRRNRCQGCGGERKLPPPGEKIRGHREQHEPGHDHQLHGYPVGQKVGESHHDNRGEDRVELVGREAIEPVPAPSRKMRQHVLAQVGGTPVVQREVASGGQRVSDQQGWAQHPQDEDCRHHHHGRLDDPPGAATHWIATGALFALLRGRRRNRGRALLHPWRGHGLIVTDEAIVVIVAHERRHSGVNALPVAG